MNQSHILSLFFGCFSKKDFTYKRIIFIILFTLIATVVNIIAAYVGGLVRVSLYLDTLMTFCVTALCGLIPGIICAFFTNFILTVYAGHALIYVICHIGSVFIASFCFQIYEHKYKNSDYNIDLFLIIGILAAIFNGITGSLITDIIFGGLTGAPQTDATAQAVFSAIQNRMIAVYWAGLIQNLTDKVLSGFLSFIVYHFINNCKSNFYLRDN